MEANSEYTITWYSKRVSGSGAFNVYVMNADGYANLKSVSGQNWMTGNSGKWVKNEYVVETGSATAIIVKFSSETNNAGVILIDDVNVAKVGGGAPVTPPSDSGEVVVSTDFESGTADGWNSDCGLSVIEDGSKAVELKCTNDYSNMWKGIELKANTDYVVSFKAKAAAAKDIWVKFLKGDWSGTAVEQTVSLSTAWKEYSVTMNTGANTGIVFMFQQDGVKADNQILWFDDITVSTVGSDTPDTPDTPVTPSGDNLIVNGDFEKGTEGWTLSSAATVIADDVHQGNGALKLNNPGAWSEAALQKIAVESNTEYVVEMYTKRIGSVSGVINLAMMNAAGYANLTVVEGQNWFNTANTGWEKRTIVVNTGDATEIILKWTAEGNNPGVLLVDDITVSKKGADQPDTPDVPSVGLINGDFEKGAEGWTMSSAASIINDDVHKGNGALRLENPAMYSGAAVQNVAVKPNTEYVVEVFTKRVSGNGAFYLFMMNSANNANLKLVEGQNWFNTNDADWTKRTIVIDTESATEIIFKWSAEADNAGVMLVDDLTIYEKGAEPVLPMNGLITNGGFETGDISGWENLYGACNPEVNESSRFVGDYGLYFTSPKQWSQVRQNKIPVEPNTDYTLVAWAANAKDVQFIIKSGDDSADIASIATETGNEWKKYELKFNTDKWDSVCVLIITSEEKGAALVDDIGLYKTGEEPEDPSQPDDPVLPPISLSLDSFGVLLNRPVSADKNLIVNGSFENAEGGQWQELLGDTYYVVDDETAPNGGKSLFFNTSGVAEQTKLIFWMDVVPNTDYVFSTWLKGAFISDENRYDATIGVVDPNGNFLVYDGEKFSNKDRQIVPTCWDNEWHLRSVQFNSGRAEKIGIAVSGKLSQLWIDDMALFTVDNSTRYTDPAQFSYIGPMSTVREEGGCAEEDSLIPDANMDDAESVEFWSTAMGFENGFISFPENKYEYGTSMKYTESGNPCGTHAIKWIDVKPNTEYTFSVDIRVVKDGGGRLILLDNKLREKEEFLMVDFDRYYYGSDWFNTTVNFDSGNFDRIGIAIVDGGGEALIDNMRLFERVNMVEGGINDKYVKPPYSFDEPDSPDTGVSVLGAVLAVAVVPASAAVALGLRRKKEDEE